MRCASSQCFGPDFSFWCEAALLTNSSEDLPRWRRWLRAVEFDRAAAYAVAARGWPFLAGPVTLLLIAASFSLEAQGWFYTLGSLLALQTLGDLGLSTTLVHASSHAWSRLERRPNGRLAGDDEALAEIAGIRRGGYRWYGLIASLFAVGAGIGGLWFLGQTPTSISWQGPWLAAVICTAGSLLLTVDLAILEGCGQVAQVQRLRLVLAIIGNLVVWTGLMTGAQLWVVPISAAVRVIGELWLVFGSYRTFWPLVPATRQVLQPFRWKESVWPLQWRAAVQSLIVFLAYQLFVPILFRTQGPAVAGQFGMTWSILVTLQSAAIVWVQTRASQFGVFVRRQQYAELDHVFGRIALSSFVSLVLGVGLVTFGVALLPILSWIVDSETGIWILSRLKERLLPLGPTVLLGLGVIAVHLPQCQTLYLRSHLRDPLLWPTIFLNGSMAILAVLGARWTGAFGLALAYFAVTAGGVLPVWTMVWLTCRKAWRAERS